MNELTKLVPVQGNGMPVDIDTELDELLPCILPDNQIVAVKAVKRFVFGDMRLTTNPNITYVVEVLEHGFDGLYQFIAVEQSKLIDEVKEMRKADRRAIDKWEKDIKLAGQVLLMQKDERDSVLTESDEPTEEIFSDQKSIRSLIDSLSQGDMDKVNHLITLQIENALELAN
ncbi:hypothetical protein [Vibrio sp. Hal054]|uniref:hypothetical protein n=1 Tax=Vibrio sp. Hal054 TaxID=3035158 RepID=UPI00301DB30A